jgi:beta-lactamase class D
MVFMHKRMFKYSISIIAILLPVFASAEDLVISRLFAEKGVDGNVVIYSMKSGQTFIHNDARVNMRFFPSIHIQGHEHVNCRRGKGHSRQE